MREYFSRIEENPPFSTNLPRINPSKKESSLSPLSPSNATTVYQQYFLQIFFRRQTSRDLRFFGRVLSRGSSYRLPRWNKPRVGDKRREHETPSSSPFYFTCLPCQVDSGLMAVEWDWIDLMGAVKVISQSSLHCGRIIFRSKFKMEST